MDLWIMINLFDALTILEKVIALRWILQKLKIAICNRKYESLIEKKQHEILIIEINLYV